MSTKPIGLRWLRMIVWLSGLVFPLPSQNAPDSPARAVVFINGFQYPDNIGDLIRYGTCPPSRSTPRSGATFGEFENLLAAEGFRVYFFDNCVECPGSSIEECGEALGRYLERHSAGEVAPSGFDLVAHSMGGLIARAYLSGMKRGAGFDPPLLHRVRKLVTLGTPHFGSYRSLDLPFVSAQLPQMVPGSRFLWELNRWNAGADDLRGTDALAVVGNACMASWLDAAGDGLVSLQSAALSFARGPERTRVIPYRHTDSAATFCPGKAPLASISTVLC